ncbi:MAG: acyl-CoA thioesterase [Candidatus Izimaplasma sp.]|nr:acyl-CoA thioesterase [Candidatus Izimaplasma bacterium]
MVDKNNTHKLKIQLRYSDSDQMGVIYHANYFSFFEQGRTAFLKELGFDYYKVEEEGIIFPVRDVSCTYLKAMRFGEEITISTKLHKLTKIKITYYHEVHNSVGELKATGYTTVISVDKETFNIIKMDEKLKDIYQKYLGLL